MVKTRKLNPKCLLAKKSLAVTNEGIVLPCCECDSKQQWRRKATPLFIRLTRLSNIQDFDSIDDVISQPIWKEFQDELLEDRGPEWCYLICGIDEEDRTEHAYTTFDQNKETAMKFHQE